MMDPDDGRKRLNRTRKRALAAADARVFIQQYGRKRQDGYDPNDRTYDRETEAKLKRIDPIRLDEILRDDED
jgi:hypothetical protein